MEEGWVGMVSRWLKRAVAMGAVAAAMSGWAAPVSAAPTVFISVVNNLRDECLDGRGAGAVAQVAFCDQGPGQTWMHRCPDILGRCDAEWLVNPHIPDRMEYCLTATADADGALVYTQSCFTSGADPYLKTWGVHPIPDSANAVKYVLQKSYLGRWKCLGRRGDDVVVEFCSTAGTQLWRYR